MLTRLFVGLLIAVAAGLPGPALGYEVVEVKDAGVLVGTVRLAGEPVQEEPIPVRKNQEVCGETKPFEALIVGPKGGVRNTVVYLEGVERGKRPAGELALDNAKCLFVPRVSAVMVGAPARVRNSDPILHNTHGFMERLTVFNLALPIQGQTIDIARRLKRPGVIEVLCDAHTHMRAWIVVRDNPYFAVTDPDGRFRIDGIPPGAYRVVAWHEGWKVVGKDKDGRNLYDAPRVVTREVTIPAGGEAKAEFELK